MTDNGEERSQIVPLLVAVVICDTAVEDPNSRKKTLVGIFDRVWVREFPTRRQLSLYLKVADSLGHYDVQVKFVQVSTGEMLNEVSGKMEASDRLASGDFFIPFDLEISSEGRYEFQIWFNGMYIGQTFLDASPMPTS